MEVDCAEGGGKSGRAAGLEGGRNSGYKVVVEAFPWSFEKASRRTGVPCMALYGPVLACIAYMA